MRQAPLDDSTSDGAHRLLQVITRGADRTGVGISITTTGPDGRPRMVYSNEGLRGMLGYSEEELSELNPMKLMAPEEAQRIATLFAQQRGTRQLTRVARTTLQHSDGHFIDAEASTARMEIDGEVLDVSFVVDVQARSATRDALRESEKRLREFIDHAPDGVITLRFPHILSINPAAAPMLGFADPAQAPGQDIRTRLEPVPGHDGGEVELGALLTRPREVAQFRRRSASGAVISLEISTVPTEVEGQAATLAFVRDVTERNSIMESMIEADKLAAVGTLAAGVAHEINNPLAYVMLNLEFLSRELPKLAADPGLLPDLQQRLVDIRQGAERVKTIVRDLQAFTRRDEEIRGPIELESVMDNAMHLARHEIRHRARLVRRFQMVPPVRGNATRLEQLFLNLLVNAAHALEAGDPDADVIEVAMRHTPRWVVVEVRDTGCGMTEEDRLRAFEAFYTTKPQGVGTGLGLAICHDIVRGLGGEIEIESELDQGTTVRVMLPPDLDTRRPSTLPPPPAPRADDAPRGRILLIDDEITVAESLGYALRDDHEVDIATSAGTARKLLDERGSEFDVILCDLVMPGEGGMEVYAHVQETQPALCPRFVFMTGGVFLPRAETFLARIENRHIEKPFDLEALAGIIDGMLAKSAK